MHVSRCVLVLPRLRALGRVMAGPLVLGLALLHWALTPALAHPHIWVTVRTTVLYDNGAMVGFRHAWTFDDLYTAMAIEGLDADKDGKYTREELAELAQVNIEALKEFGYFTFPRLKGHDLAVIAPSDYYLEHAPKAASTATPDAKAAEAPEAAPQTEAARTADASEKPANELTLHFTLPLEKPVLADAEDISFSIGDPTFFIAFEPAAGNAVSLGAGAPKACRIESPNAKPADANAGKSGDLMAAQPSDLSINIVSAPSWRVVCAPAG